LERSCCGFFEVWSWNLLEGTGEEPEALRIADNRPEKQTNYLTNTIVQHNGNSKGWDGESV
jgi:hypothetical protein